MKRIGFAIVIILISLHSNATYNFISSGAQNEKKTSGQSIKERGYIFAPQYHLSVYSPLNFYSIVKSFKDQAFIFKPFKRKRKQSYKQHAVINENIQSKVFSVKISCYSTAVQSAFLHSLTNKADTWVYCIGFFNSAYLVKIILLRI